MLHNHAESYACNTTASLNFLTMSNTQHHTINNKKKTVYISFQPFNLTDN